MVASRLFRTFLVLSLAILAIAPAAFGQQTGSLSGRVTSTDGQPLPGATVEANCAALPQARVTTTNEAGEYRLPVLPPGPCQLTFSLAGLETKTRKANVSLGLDTAVNASLGLTGVAETITVTAEASLVNKESTEVASALAEKEIDQLPIGQEYRDLLKLVPGVQYTEDTIRGPSAGASGQDNEYQFDGVNVTLPLFGTLAAEPSTKDIAQVEVIRGGAKATDFIRAAGVTFDTVSKSGTNEFKGELEYQYQGDEMRGEQEGTVSVFEEAKSWLSLNLGGPILRDRLFFFGSYYHPLVERTERSNVYGPIPDLENRSHEYFGKLTYTPLNSILLHGSYRDKNRDVTTNSVGTFSEATTALGEEAHQKIAILEASWVINQRSFLTGKFNDFALETSSVPDHLLPNVVPSIAAGTTIDINNLQNLGLLVVPTPISGQDAHNAFIAPIINRYGYLNSAGVRTGGGEVGVGSTLNDIDFYRQSAQLGYDYTLDLAGMSHDLHAGWQWYEDAEDLRRTSNGWGVLRVIGGRLNFTPPGGTATPIFYQAEFTRPLTGSGAGEVNIHSEYVSHNIEINDTIRWGNWSFNVGAIASNDTLYGQGLREDSSQISGYVFDRGNKYKMHEIPFSKTIAPRLGATWAYNGSDNVYVSYSKYFPSASSLPRAASWDRNTLGLATRVHFDQNGVIIGSEQVASSTGKLFQDDLDPRNTEEFMLGTQQQFTPTWSGRAFARYRYGSDFWEDTNNDARERWAPEGYSKALYIPDLADKLTQIGTGGGRGSYVIAQLDGAFNKYYELNFESDWRHNKLFVRGSYTWSHFYGNFDQDNTTSVNDASVFIGSSFIADGPGRQLWDNRYGDLRGDRRNMIKLFGSYDLPWNAVVGAFAQYQSGQPWETWNYRVYQGLPGFGTSTSDTSRFAEPAGRHRTDDHHFLDLSYTQNIPISRFTLQLDFDIFNVYDNQTGYNVQPALNTAGYGAPRDFFDPRRYQLAVRVQF